MKSHLLVPLALLSAPIASQQQLDIKPPAAPPPMVDADRKQPAPPPPLKVLANGEHSAPSQDGATVQVKAPAGKVVANTRIPEATVLVDQPGDGRTWVRTRQYKASFDGTTATYIPFLGSDAPKNYPVGFSLRSVRVGGQPVDYKVNGEVTATRSRVSIDRAGLVENYDLTGSAIEQSFVFRTLPAGGDLVVRIEVETELLPVTTADGFRFSNELGQVSYGEAFVLDAGGRRERISSMLDGGVIQLRVPDAFLASARFPVTIDPVVTTFTARNQQITEYGADIAYDHTLQQYLIVWEEAFSATDHDVGSILQNGNGAPVAGSLSYIDQTSTRWSHARVANLRLPSRFLVVAERGVTPSREIWGRIRVASSGLLSAIFDVSANAGSGDKLNPDVGGDANPGGPVFWTVVFERTWSPTDSDILAQQVADNGNLQGGVIEVANTFGTRDTRPAISKSDGDAPGVSQDWTVVWQRTFNPTDEDIWFAQIHWNGTLTATAAALDTATRNQTNPSVSSPTDAVGGSRFTLVCYELEIAADNRDIGANLLRGNTVVRTANLSTLEGASSKDQITPHVDSDGCRFMVTWAEEFAAQNGDWDILTSTFHMVYGSALGVSDSRVTLANTLNAERRPRVTSTRSGGGSGVRYAAVWDYQFSASDLDIQGGIYDGVAPGGFVTLPTGCGALGMAANGSTALGRTASFNMTNVGANVPVMMFSLPISSVTVCGTCALGVNLSMATLVGGNTMNIPIPPEGAFVGGTLAVQGFTYGIGPCIGGAIRMSDTARFTIR